MTLELLDEARNDIIAAHDWYESKRDGLGADFELCIEEAFARIAADPQAWAVWYRKTRRLVLARFPHGQPPDSLGELVPDYLAELPSTGMKNYPSYEYRTGDAARLHHGNPWVIWMGVGYGMGFDEFVYYPLQNYPEHSGFERLGKWAYFHE